MLGMENVKLLTCYTKISKYIINQYSNVIKKCYLDFDLTVILLFIYLLNNNKRLKAQGLYN